MRTRIVSDPINFEDINVGDEITFDYTNAKNNIPSRVGLVLEKFGSNPFKNDCIKVYDYSLFGGPYYRSYRREYVCNLGRLVEIEVESPPVGRLARYTQAIIGFGKKLIGANPNK